MLLKATIDDFLKQT